MTPAQPPAEARRRWVARLRAANSLLVLPIVLITVAAFAVPVWAENPPGWLYPSLAAANGLTLLAQVWVLTRRKPELAESELLARPA